MKNPYNSTAWRHFRVEYLAAHPRCVCVMCVQHGRKPCMKPANTVDHVIPARLGNVTRFAANCRSCHSRKTALYDHGFGH